MEKKFNLSEKRDIFIDNITNKHGLYWEEDVKEFIKRRNQEEIQFLNYLKEYPELTREKIPERIKEINENKLAGDKLV